jgi:hypothetical protein
MKLVKQYCARCNDHTMHRRQKISVLGALAIDMITGVWVLMAASICTPVIGWLFIPLVIMAMFVVTPFAIVVGVAGSMLPKTEDRYECVVCGRIRNLEI